MIPLARRSSPNTWPTRISTGRRTTAIGPSASGRQTFSTSITFSSPSTCRANGRSFSTIRPGSSAARSRSPSSGCVLTGFAVDQLAGGVPMLDELQKLWDFQHIQTLPQRYCDAIIRKDIAALAALFIADGEFSFPAAAFYVGSTEAPASEADRCYAGRKALLNMYEESFRGGI